MHPLDLAVSLAFATTRTSTPLLDAAAGGALCERGGIVNVALEGLLLGGAFASIAVAAATGSALAGLGAAVLAGVLLMAVHALATIRFQVNQIVSGIALNLLVTGLSKLLLSIQFGQAANSGAIDAARLPRVFVERGGLDLLVLGAFLAPVLVHLILERTAFGLRLRATGEHPRAAASLGVSVGWTRARGALLAGGIASLGGAWLAYDQHQFVADMTAGRGFMALAAVIFAGWRPLHALLACLLFGVLDAITNLPLGESFRQFQELVQVVPYVATLGILATAVRKARAPAALGRE